MDPSPITRIPREIWFDVFSYLSKPENFYAMSCSHTFYGHVLAYLQTKQRATKAIQTSLKQRKITISLPRGLFGTFIDEKKLTLFISLLNKIPNGQPWTLSQNLSAALNRMIQEGHVRFASKFLEDNVDLFYKGRYLSLEPGITTPYDQFKKSVTKADEVFLLADRRITRRNTTVYGLMLIACILELGIMLYFTHWVNSSYCHGTVCGPMRHKSYFRVPDDVYYRPKDMCFPAPIECHPFRYSVCDYQPFLASSVTVSLMFGCVVYAIDFILSRHAPYITTISTVAKKYLFRRE